MSYYVSEDLSMKLKGNWDSETMELFNLYLKCVENYIWGAKKSFAGGFRNTNQVIEWSWAGNHGMVEAMNEFSHILCKNSSNYSKYALGTEKYPLTEEKWHILAKAMQERQLSFLVKASSKGEFNEVHNILVEYWSNGFFLSQFKWKENWESWGAYSWDTETPRIDFSKSNSRHVVIADGETNIGNRAFQGCRSLQSIIIPDSVTSIGNLAFDACESLQSIIIPDSVTSIGDGAFCCCRSLRSITIPDSITSIGDRAFSYCESLRSITIPDSVTSIGDCAFSYCPKLADQAGFVIVQGTLYDYYGDSRDVVIPNGTTKTDGVRGNLQSITIPDSVTHIGVGAFSECRSLSDIVIPDGVTSIGALAFSGCSALTSIAIPEGVTHIENRTFANCTALKRITLPNSVKKIYTSADEPEGRKWFVVFQGCDAVEVIVAPRYPLSEVDSKKKRALAVGFAIAVERGYDIPDERREEYLKYIKGQKKKLYPIAVKELALLRLMLSEKMIPAADLAAVTELAQQGGSAEALELLAAY